MTQESFSPGRAVPPTLPSPGCEPVKEPVSAVSQGAAPALVLLPHL